jgi:hypothetical protein
MLNPTFKRDRDEMSLARLRNNAAVGRELLRDGFALNRDDLNLRDRFPIVAFRTLSRHLFSGGRSMASTEEEQAYAATQQDQQNY